MKNKVVSEIATIVRQVTTKPH